MTSAPLISLHSAKSPIVFINVEHLANVKGVSIGYARKTFGKVKKLANVKTHGIHLDKFLEFSHGVPELSGIKKEDFLRIHA